MGVVPEAAAQPGLEAPRHAIPEDQSVGELRPGSVTLFGSREAV